MYLDNCCFNRPFDDQRQGRVRIETEAKLCLQEHIRSGRLELAWSYMLDYENAANPFEERRLTISGWKHYATIDVEETSAILQHAQLLVQGGLRTKDALHIACALAMACAYFVTTDDDILRRRQTVQDIMIVDPTSLVREMNL
ncbi:MAG: PIN domain-containing protein [Candidatus Tectimicrobiota bacterium]